MKEFLEEAQAQQKKLDRKASDSSSANRGAEYKEAWFDVFAAADFH